ncbi:MULTISPECIES: hypothetical protein [Kosakonia]|nr:MULTISPECIES: hypothetical protein [Kosakonia]AGN85583.1 hypothetical protein H650_10535 [Enterobacter sp. R4-368]MCZ3383553.1 hypothetical protein [Kosakonia sp. SOY2]RCW96411.1 hypothetical protein DFO56_11282 [Kosakonia sp. AG348]
MNSDNRKNKTTSVNPARQAHRQMSWGMLFFCLFLLVLKFFS